MIWGGLLSAPVPLLAPPGSLLGSLGTLRGWFWDPFALLLKALSENRENPVFLQTVQHFFSMVLGSQNHPQIDQHRSKELLGHRVGRKSVPKVAWEAPGAISNDLGRQGGDKRLRGELRPATAGPPGRGSNT